MIRSTLEGTGVPLIKYPDNKTFKLPHPNGESREGIRVYEFVEDVLDSYRSEGGVRIKVGKKYLFNANLSWVGASKVHLKALLKASKQASFEFTLNEDKPNIKFKVEMQPPKFKFTKGLQQLGYDIQCKMIGIEYLDEPGYGDLELDGYGTDFGNKPGNQSP